ncbi:hypothetical protein B0T10DRAFT_264325 [Thelonectria olida]|uniref:Increased recombination centers protein 6 n=1 Tax=Thelonectria olida TaxID=1576542 RepID=A0A9P8W7F2_9HYPO|nr:hypothetical protein B0T10DRAFT_264325 [Thelonectria olida]
MAEAEMNSQSRRILAVALEGETAVLSQVIKDLTGTAPSAPSADLSIAGTTHSLSLSTPYYSTTVPVWLDTIADPSEWSSMFLSPEAVEVLAVLGGVVVVFTAASASGPAAEATRSLIQNVGKVVKQGLGGWEWDGVGLAVGVGNTDQEEWDEICADAGLEFVMLGGKESSARNEFGEKTGIARVKEALEANDWAPLEMPFSESDFGDFETGSSKDEEVHPESAAEAAKSDLDKLDLGFDHSDFEGLRQAIWEMSQDQAEPDLQGVTKDIEDSGDDKKDRALAEKVLTDGGFGELDDEDVAKMDRMMKKLLAVREAGEGMGEEQRKRMAARAVEEVMRDL